MPRVSRRTKPKHPAIPSKSKDEKIAGILARLGITEEELHSAPRITHILREIPDGGIKKAVGYLRGSDDPDARKWLHVYDDIPVSYRDLVPFEAYCVAANISPRRMLEVVTGACYEQSTAASILIAKAAHPELVKKSVEFAKDLGGLSDRKMLHQREGFAPIPKTQVINVGGDVIQDNRIQSVNVGALGGVADKVNKIADRFNERMGIGEVKQIEEGKEVVPNDEAIPGESEEVSRDTAERTTQSEVEGDYRAVEETSDSMEWDFD